MSVKCECGHEFEPTIEYRHRLLCGDSTVKADVDKVMQGELCGACVTDSPYGINREGIENDDPEGLQELLEGVLAVMPIENGVIINFQSPRLFPVWLDAIRKAGHKFERALWMYDENDQTKPWRFWLMCSQIAIISSIGKAEWSEPAKSHHDTYVIGLSREWRAGGDGNEFAHASVKPVGVIQDIMSHFVGGVYEPFCGSGTTMVACENLKRKCRGIEISPNYVAVILQRMSDAFPELTIERVI
jgi:DNA modification methylase